MMNLAASHGLRLLAVLLISIVLAACGGNTQTNGIGRQTATPAPASNATQPPNAVGETTVNVTAQDFEFVLDTRAISAGSTTFVVTNRGTMPHDFAITVSGQQHKTPLINPGESSSFTVELTPGEYQYLCTVPGHDILGMQGTLTIQ
jgi:plastocyanin